jgi:hypothetical protein
MTSVGDDTAIAQYDGEKSIVDRQRIRQMDGQNPLNRQLKSVESRVVYINFFMHLGFFIGFIPCPLGLALNLLDTR